MKFSDNMNKKAAAEVSALNWPRVFYDEMDAENRSSMLERAIEQGLEPEKDAVRKKLLSCRYGKKERGGVIPDRYMQLILECMYKERQKIRNAKSTRLLQQKLDELGMTEAASGTAAEREVLQGEIRHAIRLYASICRQDLNYSAIIFGLGRMNEETIEAKIRRDLEIISRGLDELADQNPAAAMWKAAALDLRD